MSRGEDAGQHHLVDVKDGRLELHLSCLDLGDVEHRAHHAGQSLDLVRDNGQVVPFLLLRDGSVQNAVDEAGDAGHRGLQLVRDVSDKGAAHRLLLGQTVRHVVEGHRQLADLVPLIDRHPHAEIAARKSFGGLCHLAQRAGQAAGYDVGQHKDDHHHHQHAQQKDPQDFAHKVGQALRRAGSEHHAGQPSVREGQRDARGIVGALIDLPHLAHLGVDAVFPHLVEDLLSNTVHHVVAGGAVGAHQHLPGHVRQIDIRIQRLCHRDPGAGEHGVVGQLVLAVHRHNIFFTHLRRIFRVLFQRSQLVLLKILRRKHHEHHAQHHNAGQGDGAAHRKILSEQALPHRSSLPF